jgi:DNA-binding NarL/FixJ family response regulator
MRHIRKGEHSVKVLAVSSYDDRQYIRGMLDNGAQGYITKEEASELLVEAIRSIASGENRYLSPRAARYSRSSQSASTTQAMTKREVEILQMLSLDKSEPEIAETMGMMAERLKSYLQVLMVKYGADTSERLTGIAKKIFRKDPDD